MNFVLAGPLFWSGLLPRLGPGRAAWIAVRSRITPFQRSVTSVRTEELGVLRRGIASMNSSPGDHIFMTVTGSLELARLI
jgi:hypothetical protein